MGTGLMRLTALATLVTAIAALAISAEQQISASATPAEGIVTRPGADSPTRDAAGFLHQGNNHYQAGHLEAALESWQQALLLYRQAQNQEGEGITLANLGAALVHLGRYREALTYLEAGLAIARLRQDGQSEALVLGNLGIAYAAQGRYGEAIHVHRRAGRVWLSLGDRPRLGQVLLNLGNTFEAVGDYDNAIIAYQQSLKIAQQTRDRTSEGIALGNLGQVYANQGNYEAAIGIHQQSLEIARSTRNPSSEASALINLGATYHSLGRRDQALSHYQQALKAARSAGDRRREGEALGSLGLIYDDLGQYSQAIEYLQASLAIARTLGNVESQGFALNNLGHALFGAGKLEAAEAQLRAAITLLDSLRLGLSDTYQVSIFDKQVHAYSLLQQILIASNKIEAALEAAEQGRARAFAEMLARRTSAAGRRQPLIPRQLEESGEQRQEKEGRDLPHPQTARSQSSEIKPSEIKPIDIQTIKQIARQQNATLIEYAIVPDDDFKFRGKQRAREAELFIWVVQPGGKVEFRRVDLKPLWQKNATLKDVVQVARCLMPGENCGPVAQAIRGMGVVDHASDARPQGSSIPLEKPRIRKQAGLRKLYDLLIAPIADLLPQDPNARLIFIPQESLFLVPFAALQAPDGQYLIERHTLLTAPSIQVLELTRQQGKVGQSPAVPSALIVGNPTMPTVTLEPGQSPEPLAPLPGAEQEALKIAELLQTTALIGQQATKEAVIKQLPTAQIIHLATHGLLEYGSQGSYVSLQGLGVPGAIALAPSAQDNGLLMADEILDFNLRANLVVLSACNTGQGRITGDGVIGLSRAFISAGVPSVVVSLWAVPDAPTARLMTSFYQNLQRNPDKAIALRQAMLDTMQDYPQPLDWAAFTLIGEAE